MLRLAAHRRLDPEPLEHRRIERDLGRAHASRRGPRAGRACATRPASNDVRAAARAPRARSSCRRSADRQVTGIGTMRCAATDRSRARRRRGRGRGSAGPELLDLEVALRGRRRERELAVERATDLRLWPPSTGVASARMRQREHVADAPRGAPAAITVVDRSSPGSSRPPRGRRRRTRSFACLIAVRPARFHAVDIGEVARCDEVERDLSRGRALRCPRPGRRS